MNEFETKPSGAPSVEQLQEQVQSLQRLLGLALAASLLLGASVTVFLWGQQRILKGQLREAATIVSDHDTKSLPMLTNFIASLQAYGKTHPDFAPLVDKYGLKAPAGPAASAPTPAPKPAPPRK
jgi:hypothetical protein